MTAVLTRRASRHAVRLTHISTNGAPEIVDRVRPMHRHGIGSPTGDHLVRGVHRTTEFRGLVVGHGRLVHRSDQAGPRE
jgi:hypothetical protein